MGRAFTDIPRGPGISYFAAVSLAWGESIVGNFGASPLQFPQPDFSPLQSEKSAEDSKAHLLLAWLDQILRLYPNPESSSQALSPGDYQTLLVSMSRIFEFLGPNIQSAFVVEQSFLPYFGKKLGLPEKITLHDDNLLSLPVSNHNVHLLLDLMWTFLEVKTQPMTQVSNDSFQHTKMILIFQEGEMKKCIERMCIIFMNYFRSNSLTLSYPFQIYSLRCLTALASHRKTRRYLIHHVLFDQTK
jgi:Kip1 ubiquitination-promoting complex protein 1